MRRYKKYLAKAIIVCFSFGLLSLIAPTAFAASASMYLAPAKGTFVIGGQFNVSVKVNSGGVDINAAEGKITYDTNLLEAVSVSKGGSIFPFWTTEPSVGGGAVSFGGGMPPPAYNGSAGHICTITFRAKKAGSAAVRFTNGAVLANDGKGTNVLASMGSANYVISPKVAAPPSGNVDVKKETPKPKPVELEYNKPTVESSTHPDSNVWYKNNEVKFNWELPTGVTGVSILFDENPTSNPGPSSDGKFAEKIYTDVEDGVHYLHIKFKDSKKWGTIEHFRVMVDTTPPKPFEVEIRRIDVSDWPELLFEAVDEKSGLEKYEIFVGSLEHQAHELDATIKTLKMSDLGAGEHTALVKAIDKAGNERVVTVHFVIDPIEAPVILNYPVEIKSIDNFFVNGTAVNSAEITVYISDGKETVEAKVQADAQGNWFYVHEDGLGNGRYTAWAVAQNAKGIKSYSSAKVSFLVSPPVFAVIGSFVVNYFTIFVSLLFMIVLIVLLILYIIGFVRKRLKKETLEIEEVLEKNAKAMKETIKREFDQLEKFEKKVGYKKEKEKMAERLLSQVDENAKKSIKEVRDVEDILR